MKLNISSIWFGSGVPSNQATATDLTSKKIKADIIDKRQSGMDCLITFRISNLGQPKAIVLSELGFYATNESGTEVLFSTVIDPNPATLPAKGTNDAEYRQTMTMAFGYSNSDSVTLTPTIVDGAPTEYVNGKIAESIATHNANAAAHTASFKAISDSLTAYSKASVIDHNADVNAHTPILNTHNSDVNAHLQIS